MTDILPTFSASGRRRVRGAIAGLAAALMLAPAAAMAAASVSWLSPPDGSQYVVGTNVTPTGRASGFDIPGDGLDLALVLDASGSMLISNSGKTRQQWQRDAAIALVKSLPTTNTSVAVAQFAGGGLLRLGLTGTDTQANLDSIEAEINAVPASGSTAISTGIARAATELTTNGTTGRTKQMVVLSDGSSASSFTTAASNAAADGIIVHSVALPGANTTQMQAIATNGGGVFVDFSDPDNLDNLIDQFTGTGGGFVGVSNVRVILPDGTEVANALTDAFGNFSVNWAIELGDNPFKAIATFADGSSLEADLNLRGVNVIPLPASVWLLIAGVGAMFGLRRRRMA